MTHAQPDNHSEEKSGQPNERAQPTTTFECMQSSTVLVPLSWSAKRICIDANSLPNTFFGDGNSLGCLYQKY
eukprot:6072852-Karenia_brevis.AAC.1